MRLPSYVSRSRHGIYYLRVVTPKLALQANPLLPKEIRKSLNTRCPREAVVRSGHMALDLQHLYSVIAGVMSSNDNYNTKFTAVRLKEE